jgi:hypothetical protein
VKPSTSETLPSAISPSAYDQPEQLPDPEAVAMSPDAYEKLTAWGLSEEHISGLKELTGRYEYGNCAAKFARIADAGGLIDRSKNTVVLPGFVEFKGPRKDGQCNEIATKMYTDMHVEGQVERINQTRAQSGKQPLEVFFVSGNSNEYFTDQKGSSHYWVGMTEQGAPLEDGILLDGSLQKIATHAESGYTVKEWNQSTHLQARTSIVVPLNKTKFSLTGKPKIKETHGCVVGVTESRDSVVSIDCVESNNKERPVQPALYLVDKDSSYASCTFDRQGRVTWIENGGNISAADRVEAERLLETLRPMRFSEAPPSEITKYTNERVLFSIYDDSAELVDQPV